MSAQDAPLRVERWLAAPPERVYAHFTQAELWQRWQGTAARLDARPGGELWIALGDGTGAAAGRFVELVPYSVVSFTWGYVDAPFAPLPSGSTLVRVELAAERGGTRLLLTHGALPPGLRELHDEGWGRYLERLDAAVGGRDGGIEPSLAPR